MTEGYRENEHGKRETNIQMNINGWSQTARRKANRSLRKNGKRANVEKVHKNPYAQLFLLHCTFCMVLVNLKEHFYLFYSCKLPLTTRAPFPLLRRQSK